jgi:hypothetical protein
MSLGQLLIDRELVTEEQVEKASRRVRLAGGSIADSLLALEFITRERLEDVLEEPPLSPETLDDTGLGEQFLLNYTLRLLYVTGVETVPEAAEYAKLPARLLSELFEQLQKRRMVEVLGPSRLHASVLRYALSDLGRERAMESMGQCQYTGPVPVRLAEYRVQVAKQALAHERSTPADLRRSFQDLVLPQELLDNLGPAINSGKAVLLYGGAGNGKTSVAEGVGRSFRQTVYLPHAIEVDGQIIRLFDPAVHEPVEEEGAGEPSLLRDAVEVDPRWVKCRRPIVMTGGELTIEMLDLSYDEISKFYEAPAHIKATGGVFIIDDFGRQRCGTMELLNRWILPLERRVDYMTLHTGMKLELPFDQMVVFSTNFPPEELMDAAALRRINYKVQRAHAVSGRARLPDGRVLSADGADTGGLPSKVHRRARDCSLQLRVGPPAPDERPGEGSHPEPRGRQGHDLHPDGEGHLLRRLRRAEGPPPFVGPNPGGPFRTSACGRTSSAPALGGWAEVKRSP